VMVSTTFSSVAEGRLSSEQEARREAEASRAKRQVRTRIRKGYRPPEGAVNPQ